MQYGLFLNVQTTQKKTFHAKTAQLIFSHITDWINPLPCMYANVEHTIDYVISAGLYHLPIILYLTYTFNSCKLQVCI
jgi:hypothetical protein